MSVLVCLCVWLVWSRSVPLNTYWHRNSHRWSPHVQSGAHRVCTLKQTDTRTQTQTQAQAQTQTLACTPSLMMATDMSHESNYVPLKDFNLW